MGRPRHDDPGMSAKDRLVDAFWKMLAEMPYREITISGISHEANVSPNTLYYHFHGLLGIACYAIENEVDDNIDIASFFTEENRRETIFQLLEDPRNSLRYKRIKLIASSGSSQLTDILVQTLKNIWCRFAGRPLEDLTKEEIIDLEFIYGGFIATIATQETTNAEDLANFLERPLAYGIKSTLANLSGDKLP